MKKELGTAVIQARLDIRDLATLVQYKPFKGLGTKATLLRVVVESIVELLIRQDAVKRVEGISEALSILEAEGMYFKNNEGMYNYKLTRALQREALSDEDLDINYMNMRRTRKDSEGVNAEQIRKAVEIYKSGDLEVTDLSKPPGAGGSEDDSENNESK